MAQGLRTCTGLHHSRHCWSLSLRDFRAIAWCAQVLHKGLVALRWPVLCLSEFHRENLITWFQPIPLTWHITKEES